MNPIDEIKTEPVKAPKKWGTGPQDEPVWLSSGVQSALQRGLITKNEIAQAVMGFGAKACPCSDVEDGAACAAREWDFFPTQLGENLAVRKENGEITVLFLFES